MICPICQNETDVYIEDIGIGSYEYWGSLEVNSRIRAFTKCCDESMDVPVIENDNYEDKDDFNDYTYNGPY